MNDYSDSINAIKKKVSLGDTVAYKDLRVNYLEEPIAEFLPWCLLMANKYKYAPAFYDVYYTLITYNGYGRYSMDSLDVKTRQMALDYLKMAAYFKEENAIDILDSLKIRWRDSPATRKTDRLNDAITAPRSNTDK